MTTIKRVNYPSSIQDYLTMKKTISFLQFKRKLFPKFGLSLKQIERIYAFVIVMRDYPKRNHLTEAMYGVFHYILNDELYNMDFIDDVISVSKTKGYFVSKKSCQIFPGEGFYFAEKSKRKMIFPELEKVINLPKDGETGSGTRGETEVQRQKKLNRNFSWSRVGDWKTLRDKIGKGETQEEKERIITSSVWRYLCFHNIFIQDKDHPNLGIIGERPVYISNEYVHENWRSYGKEVELFKDSYNNVWRFIFRIKTRGCFRINSNGEYSSPWTAFDIETGKMIGRNFGPFSLIDMIFG